MNNGTGSKKSHRERKNPRSHELYLERNKERNAARPKQEFIPNFVPAPDGNSMVLAGGTWLR